MNRRSEQGLCSFVLLIQSAQAIRSLCPCRALHPRLYKKTQKQLGGGLGKLVNNKWATNFTVRETVNTKHYEMLTVSLRPHYLPREFGQITVTLVYVPGPDFTLAADRIAENYNKVVSRSPDQLLFVLGDFNRCDISYQLPTLHQYVSCPTRMDKMLDMCFGNIHDVYVSKCRLPLG